METEEVYKRKNLTNLEKKIIDAIVENNIPAISYHRPEIQLGEIAETNEIRSALHNLDYKFRALKLNPTLKFKYHWFFSTNCGYDTDIDVAGKLYKKE